MCIHGGGDTGKPEVGVALALGIMDSPRQDRTKRKVLIVVPQNGVVDQNYAKLVRPNPFALKIHAMLAQKKGPAKAARVYKGETIRSLLSSDNKVTQYSSKRVFNAGMDLAIEFVHRIVGSNGTFVQPRPLGWTLKYIKWPFGGR